MDYYLVSTLATRLGDKKARASLVWASDDEEAIKNVVQDQAVLELIKDGWTMSFKADMLSEEALAQIGLRRK